MEVKAYYYNAGGMTQFRYPEDTYAGWAILVPQSGRFAFAIHGGDQAEERAAAGLTGGTGGAGGIGGSDGASGTGEAAAEGVGFERTGASGAGADKAPVVETTAATYSGEAAFGELVLCPPGYVLKRSMLEPTAFHFIELSGVAEFALPAGKVRIRDVQRLGSTCAYLARLRAEQSYIYQEEVAHLIRDLLFLVRLEQASAAASRRETTEPLMHHAAALMERGACEPDFSLQRIAGQCGLRASQLSTRFHAAYGMSPIRFATSVRLAKAAKLLVETDLTLDDVAERCGYQNAFYFSRVFSKQMKISPSLFRRANRV